MPGYTRNKIYINKAERENILSYPEVNNKFFTPFFMILFIAYGDYSVAAAETSGMENVQFINFIIKFSNFHRVFCTADGQIGH
jgi:hypothetical protein